MSWLCGRYGRRVSCDILCCATMLCNQDHELPNVGPLQKKFMRHNGLIKMLCAIWCNVNIFLSFFMLQSRQIYKKNRGCVDVSRTTFCMITTHFMSHNLVVQSCMIKLLSVWTHLKFHIFCVHIQHIGNNSTLSGITHSWGCCVHLPLTSPACLSIRDKMAAAVYVGYQSRCLWWKGSSQQPYKIQYISHSSLLINVKVSFDSYWTTLHDWVFAPSDRWRC